MSSHFWLHIKNKSWPCWYGNHYRFCPNVLATLLTILLLPIFIKLGLWQWHKGELNQQLLAYFAQQRQIKTLLLNQEPQQMNHLLYRQIKLQGQFINEHTFLLDNEIHNHRIGYRVYTLFIPAHFKRGLLVDRGFIAAPRARWQLPEIPLLRQQTITGVIAPPAVRTLVLGKGELTTPRRISEINWEFLRLQTGWPLYRQVIVATSLREPEFVRIMPTPVNKIAKHQSYAWQWFSFALLLVVIYFGLNFKRVSPHEKNL